MTFAANGYLFKNNFTRPTFLGYRILYQDEEVLENENFSYSVGEVLKAKKFITKKSLLNHQVVILKQH